MALTERERTILECAERGMTLLEIAKKYNITRERVRYRLAAARRKTETISRKDTQVKHRTLADWQQAATSLYAELDAPRLLAVEACETALTVLTNAGLAPGNATVQCIVMGELRRAIAANKEIGEQT